VDGSGIYRVMYAARFEDAVYVLHCLSKKTQKTIQRDKDMTIKRYKAMVEEK
jgi:phage-related protein